MTFFDDEYTGQRWRYGLTFRPVGVAQVPNWIINSDRKHPLFPFGTIDWPYELTRDECDAFELAPVEIPALTHPSTFGGVPL